MQPEEDTKGKAGQDSTKTSGHPGQADLHALRQRCPPASLGCDHWNGKVREFGERSGDQDSCCSLFHLRLSLLVSVKKKSLPSPEPGAQ